MCLLGWGGDSGGNNGPDAILTLAPGEDWQARVDAAPAGAVFTVKAGVHRLQTVTPKSDQQFLAEPGAVMSGAKLLDDWVQSGATWYVDGQTQEFGHDVGVCAPGKACQYPEDVYRDDVLLHRELSLAAVGPGDFYFDYAADRIYVGDDPVGHRLEAAATEYAFLGSPEGAGTGVVVRGLIIEKYANAAQFGAIGRSNTPAGWVIEGCEIRYNHGAGIRTGNIQVIRSHIHHNGQIGIVGGGGSETLISDNEIDHNNTVGFAPDWEGGGVKFGGGYFTGIRVQNNQIHHNDGIGLWADGDIDQFVWDGNTVVDNTWDGVKVEISYGGEVTGNVIEENGFANPNDFEGAGILIYSSGGSGLTISGNVLSGNHNGIVLIGAERGNGPLGPLITKNVSVHDNDLTLEGNQATGAHYYGVSSGLWTTDHNHFAHNAYQLQSAGATPFLWEGARRSDAEWRAYGNDEHGTFNR